MKASTRPRRSSRGTRLRRRTAGALATAPAGAGLARERQRGRQHAARERVTDERGLVAQAQLAHGVGPMGLGRARADGQTPGDAGAAVALGHELEDLALAAGERLVG